MAPVESDVPERSVRRWPPPLRPASHLARRLAAADAAPQPSRTRRRGRRAAGPAAGRLHLALQRRRVKRADGPERIYGEWGKRDAEMDSVRDDFAVEDEAGERFCLYRQGDGEMAATGDLRWFVQGVFA